MHVSHFITSISIALMCHKMYDVALHVLADSRLYRVAQFCVFKIRLQGASGSLRWHFMDGRAGNEVLGQCLSDITISIGQ